MTAAETGFRSARRHLEVFEEAWQTDHEDAMRCRDFELFLQQGILVFRVLDRLSRSWREDVFRGVVPPSRELEAAEKECYTRWLGLAEALASELSRFGREFETVEGAAEFKECRALARAFLDNWVPAAPSLAVGLQQAQVSEEEANQIQELLRPGTTAGRPTRPSRSVPAGDPSLLK